MKLNALILAAGTGSRLGILPKSLIKFNGIFLIEQLINDLNFVGIPDITVVTGFRAEEVEKVCLRLGAKVIFNPNYANGNHQESLEIGAISIQGNPPNDGTIIALADQPLLNSALIMKLINQFEFREETHEAIYPINDHQRGNPTLISRSFFKKALAVSPFDLKRFMTEQSINVAQFKTNNPGYYVDIDTENDIQDLFINYGIKLEMPVT